MVFAPAGRLLVVHVACPAVSVPRHIGPDELAKPTDPVAVPALPDTASVKVTFWPAVEGLSDDVRLNVGVTGPPGAAAATPHASISTRRVSVVGVRLTFTRIRSVVNAPNVTVRFTRLLPATLPRSTHAEPFQPSTVKSMGPRFVNVIASVGWI